MRKFIEPETVLVEHDAKEALARMDAGGIRHLCVIDGDLVIGVLSRERLKKSLREDENAELHSVMEKTALVLSAKLTRDDALKTLNFHDAPYALIVDDDMQVCELIEREAVSKPTGTAASSTSGRFIELGAEQQAGSAGNALKVYSERPHIEKQRRD